MGGNLAWIAGRGDTARRRRGEQRRQRTKKKARRATMGAPRSSDPDSQQEEEEEEEEEITSTIPVLFLTLVSCICPDMSLCGDTRKPCNLGVTRYPVSPPEHAQKEYTLRASLTSPDSGSAPPCKRAESRIVALASNQGASALPALGWGILGLAGDCLPQRGDTP
jgi:hypothetical protein